MKFLGVVAGIVAAAVLAIIGCCIKIGSDSSWYEEKKAEEQERMH